MEYNIAPKPKSYKGVLFRSSLEARFAVFFDINPNLFTNWIYEPIVKNGYMPDFLAYCPCINNEVIIEIKPSFEFIDIDKYANSFYGQRRTFVVLFLTKKTVGAVCFNEYGLPLQKWLNNYFKSSNFKKHWDHAHFVVNEIE